jgi:chromate transporter
MVERVEQQSPPRSHLPEIAALFLRLGFTAFGGPAAHVAMMRDEVVSRRKWISDDGFLDLLGATNLIPGPNSTEMAIHLGYLRAGLPGLVTAGASFILPAFFMVLGLAWVYVRYGATPQAGWLLYGIKPVIIAIILQALWSLGKKAVKTAWLGVVGAAVLACYFLGANEILLLVGAGLLVAVVQNARRWRIGGGIFGGMLGTAGFRLVQSVGSRYAPASLLDPRLQFQTLRVYLRNMFTRAAFLSETNMWARSLIKPLGSLAAIPYSLPVLFLTFLKIGSILYGSGYVLLAFLQRDLVVRLGWLTSQQLIDAIAIGQVTPGPVFTTATFIGYYLGGFSGAVAATLGIFLPSFIFVAISNPLIPRLRKSAFAGALLDGVNVAALGLMAAVTWQLGQAAIVDPLTIVLALLSLAALFRFKVNSFWLVVGGALIGWLRFLIF